MVHKIHLTNFIKRTAFEILALVCVIVMCGCSTNIEKIIPRDSPAMEQVYSDFTGTADSQRYEERKRELQLRALQDNGQYINGYSPFPERTRHLYPKLPNPELYMYVRAHAVGSSGAPIPSYITRFTMYEKTHYALPGETIETIRTLSSNPRPRRSDEECSSCSVPLTYRNRPAPTNLVYCEIQKRREVKGKGRKTKITNHQFAATKAACLKRDGKVVSHIEIVE